MPKQCKHRLSNPDQQTDHDYVFIFSRERARQTYVERHRCCATQVEVQRDDDDVVDFNHSRLILISHSDQMQVGCPIKYPFPRAATRLIDKWPVPSMLRIK